MLKAVFYTLLAMLMIKNGISQDQPPYGLTERVANNSFLISTSGDTLAEMDVVRAFNNLTFSQPVFLTGSQDGSDRVFVVEKRGTIRVFPNQQDIISAGFFLDIRSRVTAGYSESGMLSMAFHPQFPDSNKFYVYYNFDSLYSRISEFKVSDNPDSADENSERVILELAQPYTNHNGGQIAFGPDGYLYIGFGDGGSGGDPKGNGQNPKTLLGAILRLDIDHYSTEQGYSIPPDNPFAGNADGWREEIWAYGLRNPWRFSFDRLNGLLWCGDVGQNLWEEVDIIEKGKNYGWNIMEGFHCYSPASGCDTTGLTLPITEYSHSIGRSITGGYVYHGSELPRLAGIYLYADYAFGNIWGVRYEDDQLLEEKEIAVCPEAVSSFGEDENGEVYVVGYSGHLYRFIEKSGIPPVNTVPQTIASSGLYKDIATLTPADGLILYTVNAPLWSDNALKTRFLALPDTTKIGFSADSAWHFPPNAVLVKNFYLESELGNPATKKIIETRFLVRHALREQWDGYSYLWNEEQTDAVLLEGSYTRQFTIQAGDSSYIQNYYYPSRSDCKACHTPAAGFILGVRTAQVNKPHLYITGPDSVWDNQLRSYNHIRLFTENIGEDYSTFPQLADPFDEKVPEQNRARSYMDANCSFCHRPGSSGRTNMDLRYEIPLEAAHLIDAPVELDDLGISGAERIKSGAPDSSVVLLRMRDLGVFRMPPLATSLVDVAGTAVIRDWIISLGPSTDLPRSDRSDAPFSYYLYPAYPNPFNAMTTIVYQLPAASRVKLEIYDIRGAKVATLADDRQTAGKHTVQWQANTFASGIYFYKLTTDKYTRTRKMILVK
jgi:uncharacterized repeat protein (TIGR03806 family)